MDVAQRVAKNTISLWSAQIVVEILKFLLTIFVARFLGDVIFGKYSFSLAFTAFFIIFSNLGYNTLLIREVAKDKSKAKKYLNNVLGIRLFLSVIVLFLIILLINLADYPSDTKIAVYLFGIYFILVSLSDVFKVTFRAFEIMEYEAIITIIANLIRVSFSIMILFFGYGLIEVALIFVLSEIIDFVISFVMCRKKITRFGLSIDTKFLKETIKIVLPLSVLPIFSLIYVRADTIMLSFLKGDAVVGWYNAAYNLVLGFKPVAHLFMTAVFPLMSAYYVSSKKSFINVFEKSFKYLFIIGLPTAVGITLLADKLILLFYGTQYINSINALEILSWDILLLFLSMCLSFVLISINKQSSMAIIAGLSAFINVILNLILIPTYSYLGAAVATIASEAFLFVLYLIIVLRSKYIIPFHKIIIKPIIVSGIMAIFVFQFIYINLALLITTSVLIYFGIMFVIKGFSEEDLKLIRGIIKK